MHSSRLLDRFRELEGSSAEDQEAVLKLIDAMFVQQKVRGIFSPGKVETAARGNG